MNYTVYVLLSLEHKRTYTGLTSDLSRRLAEHNSGKSKWTRRFRPWILIHQEEFPDLFTARKREKYLKSGSGRELLKKILDS